MHAADYFESLGISLCARDGGKTKSPMYTQCSTDHGQWWSIFLIHLPHVLKSKMMQKINIIIDFCYLKTRKYFCLIKKIRLLLIYFKNKQCNENTAKGVLVELMYFAKKVVQFYSLTYRQWWALGGRYASHLIQIVHSFSSWKIFKTQNTNSKIF